MFKKYNNDIKKIVSEESKDTNWKDVLINHRLMIARIQHERLIHLLVTTFVGVSLVVSFMTTLITENIFLLILDFPLLALFVGYLFHYRFLENTTENWYLLEDKIIENVKN